MINHQLNKSINEFLLFLPQFSDQILLLNPLFFFFFFWYNTFPLLLPVFGTFTTNDETFTTIVETYPLPKSPNPFPNEANAPPPPPPAPSLGCIPLYVSMQAPCITSYTGMQGIYRQVDKQRGGKTNQVVITSKHTHGTFCVSQIMCTKKHLY